MIDRSKVPAIYGFPELLMPAQSVRKLGNGAMLHWYADCSKAIVRICLQYEGGMSELGAAEARLIASQLTEGTVDYSAEELADIFDFNGVRLALRASDHHLSLELNVLGSRIADVLPAFRSMIVAPSFPADHLEVAKMQLCAEIQNKRLQAPVVAHQLMMSKLFGEEHPLAHVINEDEVNAIDSNLLADKFRRIVNPAGLHVYVSGAVDAAVLSLIETFVLSLPDSGSYSGLEISAGKQAAAGTYRIPFDRSLQSAIAMGARTIDRSSSDYIDLRLAVMALGGYFGSRLMTKIREEKGLTYGIYASLSGSYDGAYVTISATCDKSYTDIVVNEIVSELNLLHSNPPQDKELETLRSYAMSSLAEALDTPYSIMGYYTMQTLVGTPDNYFEAQQRAIRALTPGRISSLAAGYLCPSGFSTVIVG